MATQTNTDVNTKTSAHVEAGRDRTFLKNELLRNTMI